MKNLNKFIIAASVVAGLSSCQKSFDASTYAPPLNIGGYTSASQIAPDNLIAHWAFDESLIDSISNTEGTATGTSFATGRKNAGLQGAANAYVVSNTPEAVQNMTSFTVTAWVNSPQNTDGIVGILDIANSKEFWGNLTMFFENGATADKGVLKVHVRSGAKEAWLGNYDVQNAWGRWINVGVTYNEATSKFVVYVNGSKLAESTQADFGPVAFKDAEKMVFGTVQFQTTPSLTSSTSKQDWASYLKGRVDEVRIYNKALNAEEIGSLVKLEGRGK
ncbi:LamG domain-containing protein [Mucilaginibacter sp. JRF]|uniref:LamG domain-containing protein n=1 Tax=Mucilaginibacter sp. JRF TaxID=2780088 RepID=UPI001882949C|nr:LamG domain-containing protein [Mucilaginibacter sp. JRF]MBE9586731.1 LamG domain-containing protein [Mucilaginibacter sp. JRF]